MSDQDRGTILVYVEDTRMRGPVAFEQLKVDVLAESVNLFLTQIEGMLEKTPDQVGKFRFTEFTVTAEVSAEGSLMLLGTGGKVAGKGGLTFKFQR